MERDNSESKREVKSGDLNLTINGENKILGRMASLVAKELLKGGRIVIVNAEKCVVSGSPDAIARIFRERTARGDPYHGPFYPRLPDRIVRRVVRGMLPKNKRGKKALKGLRVFASVPGEYEGREFAEMKGTENALRGKFLTLREVVKRI